MSGPQLAARLEGVKYQFEQAAALQSTTNGLAGYSLSEALLYGLVLLLLVEQVLAGRPVIIRRGVVPWWKEPTRAVGVAV